LRRFKPFSKQGAQVKTIVAILSLAACCVFAGNALAQTDDVRWINKCISDSAGISGTMQQKTMYCSCMVAKMDDKETRSVTQWEQANPAEMRDCAKRAGWE
jgi:hypothetical protein